jgi:hypothetical protein
MGPFTARHGCLDRFLAGRMRWSASVAGLKPGAGEVNNRYAA